MPSLQKRDFNAEYFALQKEAEEWNTAHGGMPKGSAATPPGIFQNMLPAAKNFAKEVPAGATNMAMFPVTAGAQVGDLYNKVSRAAMNPLYKAMRVPTTPPVPSLSPMANKPEEILRKRLGLGTQPQGVSGWAGNIAGSFIPGSAASIAKKLLKPTTALSESVVNPLLQRALRALPPGPSTRAQRIPSWRTASGLEGPQKWVRPEELTAVAKPKVKMPVETAKKGLRNAARLKPASAPKEPFETFLQDRLSNAAPDIINDLKIVYSTKGEDAALDLAIDLAAKGKLVVK